MTKTNFTMVRELEKVYKPKQRGFVSSEESKLIKETLQLETATELELRNMRDFVVMFYGHIEDEDGRADMVAWDKMSAVTSVIDHVLFSHGYEV